MSESFGPYQGELHAEFDAADARAQLTNFGNWLATASLTPLSEGGDQVVLTELVVSGRSVPVALKLFKRQGRLKDWYDQRQGSKAARAYQKFAVIVDKVKKLGEKAEREGKSFFEADRAAVNALINPAIGIVNDMMNGGVLNAGEREIHKQYLYDPTELLFRFWKKPDADRTYAGWDSVQGLLKDVRDNAFRVVGNKGNVGELGGTIDYSKAGMLDENMKRK